MDTTLPLRKVTAEERAALASELVARITTTSLSVIEKTEELKKLVGAFSVHHGHALGDALAGLPDVLEALLPELTAVNAHPETWDRTK